MVEENINTIVSQANDQLDILKVYINYRVGVVMVLRQNHPVTQRGNNLKRKKMKTKIWDNAESMMIGDIRCEFQNNNSSERLIRVYNGWVYTYGDMQGTSSVFIPLI